MSTDQHIIERAQHEAPLSSVTYLDGDQKPDSFSLEIFADMVTLTASNADDGSSSDETSSGGRRREIGEFSDGSRRRMIRLLARVREPGTLYFVTLTYPDQEWFGNCYTPVVMQSHMLALFRRLERAYEGLGIIWRKEYKARKSGDNLGRIAGHVHLIIRGLEPNQEAAFSAWIARAWSNVIGSAQRGATARTEVEIARSRRHAYSYVSKYVAKGCADDPEEADEVRKLLHAHQGEIGRHWGYRGVWDLSPSIELPCGPRQTDILKRLIRAWMKSRKRRKYARRLSRFNQGWAWAVLGLGDGDGDYAAAAIYRLWYHAGELSGWT